MTNRTRCFLKTDKNSIDYRALIKTGLSANIDGPEIFTKVSHKQF